MKNPNAIVLKNPKAMLLKLQQQAASGNPKAQVELQKLMTLIAPSSPPKDSSADQEKTSLLDPTPKNPIVGIHEDDEDIFAADDLDVADMVARSFPHADQLTHKAALRQNKWSGLNDVAKFARINPASCLHGTLGGQQNVLSGQQIQVANWGGDDAETTPITVTFAAVQQLGRTGAPKVVFTEPRFWRPYGIVQFGTRGFLVKAFVDIGLGTQFTITGSQCTLQVALPTDPRFDPNDPTTASFQVNMQLSGMLSFFPCVRDVPVTKTEYLDAITSGQNIVVAPPFAKNVIVWRNAVGTAFTLEFLDSDGFLLYSHAVAGGAEMAIPIVLSDDVVYVSVTLAGGAGLTTCRVIFELEF